MEQQKQRIVRTEEQILALLDEYDKSSFSVKDFCDLTGQHPRRLKPFQHLCLEQVFLSAFQ